MIQKNQKRMKIVNKRVKNKEIIIHNNSSNFKMIKKTMTKVKAII